MSRVEAFDAVVTSVGTKVGVGSTTATSTDQWGEVNVSGVLLGGAQAVHGVVDLSSKGMQATFSSTWGKAVPGVGGVLGAAGIGLAVYEGVNTRADYAGLISNGFGVVAASAVLLGASPVIAVAAATGAIIAGGYQIYSASTARPANPNYSNEGLNYRTQSYNFGPNHRGKNFTDPRRLDGATTSQSTSHVGASSTGTGSAFSLSSYSEFKPDYSLPLSSADTQRTGDPFRYGQNGWDATVSYQANYNLGEPSLTPSGLRSTAVGEINVPTQNLQSGYLNESTNQAELAGMATDTKQSGSSASASGGWNNAFDGTNTGGWEPIVIDLDGDGVEIKPLSNSTTYFDADGDEYRERTAWSGADDGLLVIDLGNDGQITQSKEVAIAEWTNEKDTDLQALAKVFDSNQDGTFDSRDARFAEFRIWKDANSNGLAKAGELITLQAAGIASMAVNDAYYWRRA